MTNELQTQLETQLAVVDKDTASILIQTFTPFVEKAKEWEAKAKTINITSIEQVEEMKQAREARLALVDLRGDVEKKRVELKEDSLRRGKAIDGMANIIKYLVKPIEEHLQKQEDFIKDLEEQKKQELLENRRGELEKYEVNCEFYNLKDMPEEQYQDLLDTSKKMYVLKKDKERKLEEERIAKEKAELEERERVAKENEKLKEEAREREKQVEADKKKADEARKKAEAEQQKKLEAERKAREKVEAELKAKKEAEEATKKAEADKKKKEEEERKRQEKEARLAPDKVKLQNLAVLITQIQLPEVKSDEAKAVLKAAVELLNKTSSYIKEKTINL